MKTIAFFAQIFGALIVGGLCIALGMAVISKTRVAGEDDDEPPYGMV